MHAEYPFRRRPCVPFLQRPGCLAGGGAGAASNEADLVAVSVPVGHRDRAAVVRLASGGLDAPPGDRGGRSPGSSANDNTGASPARRGSCTM